MGVGHHPRLNFWLTFFQSYMLSLFLSGMLSYLVGIKRRTGRRVTCKRDNSHFLRLVNIVHNAISRFSFMTFRVNKSFLVCFFYFV